MAGAGLLSTLQTFARSHGFLESSGVDWHSAKELYSSHSARYEDWVARGFAGEMGYLVRGLDRRKNPELVFPELRSIFCVLLPYRQSPLGHLDPTQGPRYARYLDGPDYHDRISKQLTALLVEAKSLPQFSSLKWKVCVDTSAVLERSWGALTGLGWIGKNTLLIHPKWGSRFFIGVAFLNLELNQAPKPHANYCGNCSRCLNACPTQALLEEGWLDSRKCISYWTLEKRGELRLSDSEKKAMSNWIAGCDLCQDACPFNTKPERLLPDPIFEGAEPSRFLKGWAELQSESESEYLVRVKDSALARVKPEMAQRNLKLAANNSELKS